MTVATMDMQYDAPVSFRTGPMLAGALALVLVLSGGWWFMNTGDPREILRLQFDGDLQHVSSQALRAVVSKHFGDGFVGLNLNAVKADVESLPWVARARVERLWPAGVRVRVWERAAFAHWGESGLLDTDGNAFIPSADEIQQELPQLSGPKGHEREVMETYRELGQKLAGTPFALTGLSLDARGDWAAQTQAGIALHLGQSVPDAKLDLLRGPVAVALRDRMSDVNYVDLRYTNGFAVGWKEQTKTLKGVTHG